MKRWRLMLGAAIALIVLVSSFYWKDRPAQFITLPNGEHYQFVTAEWGTSQIQPTFAARTVACLPAPVKNFILKKWGKQLGIVSIFPLDGPGPFLSGNPFPTPEPALHFWFRSTETTAGNNMQNDFKFMLADGNGVVGGQGTGGYCTYGLGKDKWLTFSLPVLPRRRDNLQLYLFHADNYTRGPFQQIATVEFQNPLFGHFPDWKPEPVPATKMAGDVRVTLLDFKVASANPWNEITSTNGLQTRFHPAGLGEDRQVVFKLDIDSPRGTNENWGIQMADLSDATGNHARMEGVSRWSVTDEYYFGPALWPDESAWRLALTFKKFRGYDPEEVVTFTNVPVPSVGLTDTVFRTNSVHGLPVTLKLEIAREPDRIPVVIHPPDSSTHVTVELLNHPKDFVVDFVELNGDTGWKPKEWSGRHTTNSATVYPFSIPANVHTLNLTWAVQQSRTVEFLVKPPTN